MDINNRLQICWGTIPTTSMSKNATLTFATAFISCIGIITSVCGSGGYDPTFTIFDISTTAFQAHLSSTESGGGSRNGYYLAYGY